MGLCGPFSANQRAARSATTTISFVVVVDAMRLKGKADCLHTTYANYGMERDRSVIETFEEEKPSFRDLQRT